MKTIRHSLAPLALAALISACASPVKYNTPSGKPQARFPGVSVEEVSQDIIRRVTGAGGTLVSQTPNQLVFQRKIDSVMASALLGTRYDLEVHWRARFTMFESGDGTEVVAECVMVQNKGSAFERETDATHTQGCEGAIKFFDQMRRDFAAR